MIRYFSALFLILCASMTAAACPQTKALVMDRKLADALKTMVPDSSNAWQAEQLLGPACACLPLTAKASDVWICQWKGDLSSNRLEKTLNIHFAAGMINQVVAIDDKGTFIKIR